MKRGEIWLARFGPVEGSEQDGTRPALIVSRNAINDTRRVVVVVPFTSDKGRQLLPSQLKIAAGTGNLTADSIMLTEQVRAVAKSRLIRRIGTLPEDLQREVDRKLRHVLDVD